MGTPWGSSTSMIWSLRVKEAQSREMFEDVSCIFEDESEELSFHLGFLEDHLGPKFLGGAGSPGRPESNRRCTLWEGKRRQGGSWWAHRVWISGVSCRWTNLTSFVGWWREGGPEVGGQNPDPDFCNTEFLKGSFSDPGDKNWFESPPTLMRSALFPGKRSWSHRNWTGGSACSGNIDCALAARDHHHQSWLK